MAADERTLIQGHEPTILMPAPGGQATVAMKRPAPPRGPTTSAGVELQRLVAGINPLLAAAGVLLALVPQLRTTTTHADPDGLRRQLLDWIGEFEAMAAANGVPRPKVTAARYVLCTFIDETIAQTPWAAGGSWAQRSLLQEFHEERWGGEKAFQLLERLGQDAALNADLLELFWVCLQLGFEGRYRGVPNGRAQLEAIAARVLEVIRPAKDAGSPRTLSIHWQGVSTHGHRDVSVLPLWVLLAVAGGVVLGVLLALNSRLRDLAEPVFRQVHAVPAALRLDRAATAGKPRLAPLLQADAGRGALEVRDEAQRSVIRLPADALFVPGSAQVEAGQVELLARVARALKELPGQIAVIGHTDDGPVGSLQFPSHWHLSRERAQAVLAVLVQQGTRPDRVRAEGRADVEPLVPNQGAAERARNRRIEIELRLPRPD
ncbi:type VI secretion system protein TssL, long form [Piscinibacter sp. XHJ-5]|uniref:type VI secretion system protein TssL, long form n=1 Tax=Piscinibacter sp. XHJ-5 TaxID=3037797 RepID=UPI0024534FC4|nr:type VI secretion system protein TssL, long form [Piscinibacter sp. XHJ-5]